MTRAHVVLAPHADDAVWSVGGRIAEWVGRGERVTVVTAFDGAGPVPAQGWRAVAEPRLRRRENAAALRLLGTRAVSAGLPEAALRGDDGAPRYRTPRAVLGPVHERDRALPGVLADAVREQVAGALLHVPLAAGHHVDHVLTRRAAELLDDVRIAYYEDFPYRLRARDHRGLRGERVPVEVGTWLRAAREYRSQIAALFGSTVDFEGELLARARDRAVGTGWRYADRFWFRPGKSPIFGKST
ncbi:PIG-L deacetylase family protein [Saccharopolyspora rosea]|uniref:PIG-L deacetylase family protein n=1 Tax=Saccharopolyspora rosea TaxID=524884 RepID=A0ABW3FXP0_9PSEU|nr:PIG-L family deacetylase [Saccharopolyspora rosea]